MSSSTNESHRFSYFLRVVYHLRNKSHMKVQKKALTVCVCGKGGHTCLCVCARNQRECLNAFDVLS